MTDIMEYFALPQPMGYPMAGMEPLCGWGWYEAHKNDVLPAQSIRVCYDDKTTFTLSASRAGSLKKIMGQVEHSCENVRGIG